MNPVNLIPAERRARKQRRIRSCLWTAVCGLFVALLFGGSLLLHVLHAGEDRSLTGQLAAVTQEAEQGQQTMLGLRRELAEATVALETARGIREQPDWSRLFLGLADQMGEEIVISRCQVVTLTKDEKVIAAGRTESSATPPSNAFLTECRHQLVLTGFGRTQESVSRFVLRLEDAGAFDQVRLASRCRQTFLESEAVSFSVECRF
jgi:hypothetical protein